MKEKGDWVFALNTVHGSVRVNGYRELRKESIAYKLGCGTHRRDYDYTVKFTNEKDEWCELVLNQRELSLFQKFISDLEVWG